MGMLRRRAWALVAPILFVAACGGTGASEASAPPPAGGPAATAESSPPPAAGSETTPATEAQPPPVAGPTAPSEGSEPPAETVDEPRAGSGGRVGSDLADALPTVSTMAESSGPLPETPDGSAGDSPEGIEGVVAVPVTSAEHVRHDVEYPTAPPAGGPHLGIWLNCGFYTVPVLDELAVHSLEHGAVWVTYRSDVPSGTLGELAVLAAQTSHLLVSSFEAQDSPLVLTAWARQLSLDTIEDPRFDRFLEVYLLDGPTTPEPGAACSGAVGVPPEHPEAVPQQG